MRTQIKMEMYIGYAAEKPEFDKAVSDAISRVCGGCFMVKGLGPWIDDRAQDGGRFGGVVVDEYSVKFEISFEPAKFEAGLAEIQNEIRHAAALHGVDVDWIHAPYHEVRAMHFSLKALAGA